MSFKGLPTCLLGGSCLLAVLSTHEDHRWVRAEFCLHCLVFQSFLWYSLWSLDGIGIATCDMKQAPSLPF